MNSWLARQLFLSAKRLKTFGVTGRCEAVTKGNGVMYMKGQGPQGGYQCGRPASMMRDGKRVCPAHGRVAETVLYVDGEGSDIYSEFSRLIAEIALVDGKFLLAAKTAIENVTALHSMKRNRA